MKRNLIQFLSTVLVVMMLLSSLLTVLASCSKKGNTPQSETSASTNPGGTSGETEGKNETNESDTNDSSEQTKGETSSDETEKPDDGGALEGPYADSVVNANKLANGIKAYYTSADRTSYTVENQNMSLKFALTAQKKHVASIKNTQGNSYIEDTMDVFVKMSDGSVYYSTECSDFARQNTYRLGYYYYDVHFLDQNFTGDYDYEGSLPIDIKKFDKRKEDYIKAVKPLKNENGYTVFISNQGDPYIYMSDPDAFSFSADEYNALQFTIKSTSTNSIKIYYLSSEVAGGHKNDMAAACKIANDGEFHTYTILLSKGANFEGTISQLRVDFEGSSAGEEVVIKDLKMVKATTTAPDLYIDRIFHTYSDKMHQELHFVAGSDVENIVSLGMVTSISAETVDKIYVKDANGVYSSIDGVDWSTAEYVGFDIKDAGIFGYILPIHENSGSISVELVDGNYIITQATTPTDGKIFAPINNTDNDFRMGMRIYTDENHTFDAFIHEAEAERTVSNVYIKSDTYLGYNGLNGAYEFSIGGTGFNNPFLSDWNYHYSVDVKIRADEMERTIYIRTKTTSGCLENAVLLSDSDLVLPIPLEVSKNFGSENEEPLFNCGDTAYGETVFPFKLSEGKKTGFTVLNIYQNWGNFPIKQLSSIQYFWPYYHLSVGTTETSCISPWYGARDLWTLPDFRSQSMDYWWDLEGDSYSNQPQHTHGGYQYFLQYTDAAGNHVATENISNVINSSGPLYADADMTYISDDGKIKVTYKHLEMPQMDELRAYYEISYEILDEVSIKDFANDFSFYSFEGYAGHYTKMGYWAEDGANDKTVYKDTNGDSTPEKLVLGNDSPFVGLYALVADNPNSDWAVNNVNLGFVIHSSNIVIGGEKVDDNFVMLGSKYVYSLSLDLGEVTLKPGDVIDINMIISPWGWTDSTDVSNVERIRENCCLDPLTVDVINGTNLNGVYLPEIRSNDGKTAEFTLSGGTDNVAVRVYGFNKLTAPKIEELVNGEWVEYIVYSKDNPDKSGNKHYYDGYYVYFDEDGTLSYSFAVNMSDTDARTFRVSVIEDFDKWPTIPPVTGTDTALDICVYGETLLTKLKGASGKGEIEQLEDNDGTQFIRFFGAEANEAYFTVYAAQDADVVTGQYVVIKYRIPTTNPENNYFQFFASTENPSAVGPDSMSLNTSASHKDDQWHILFVDLSKHIASFTSTTSDYCAKYLRLDIFNTSMLPTSYIDIAYIGMFNDISDLCTYNDNKGSADYVENGVISGTLDMSTGVIDAVEQPKPVNKDYIDPDSGWKKAESPYKSAVDFINGIGDGDGAYDGRGSHSLSKVDVIDFNGATVADAYLAIAGWTMVHGGVDKYMWSADNGVTWHEASLYGRDKLGDASTGMINSANSIFKDPLYDAATHKANCNYQGSGGSASGIAAHLTDYIGKTVDVTFAAVPSSEPDALCVLVHIKNVRVYASDADAEAGEKELIDSCTHNIPNGGYIFVDNENGSNDDVNIAYSCLCGTKVFAAKAPQYVFFFDSIIGSINTKNKFLASENSKGYKIIDAASEFTADSNGKITVNGWAGINGGLSKVVYKIYDADGNELTAGWTDPSDVNISAASNDIAAEMTKRNIEGEYAKIIRNLTIDLSQYFANNDKVTVKLAFASEGAEKANCADKYLPFVDIINIKAFSN